VAGGCPVVKRLPLAYILVVGRGEAMMFRLADFDLDAFVAATLAEDLGTGGDITSAATIPAELRLTAVMASRDAIRVAGLPLAALFFAALDPEVAITNHLGDGADARPGDRLMTVHGNARAILAAERSALNTVQHLSGVATLTRAYVEAIRGSGATLIDTRKTIPGLRVLEKYAVRMGGGSNHRMRLDDAVLIKDNHIAAAGGIAAAVGRAMAAGLPRIQVEVDRLDQIEPALAAGADSLLLDNMPPAVLRQAVELVAGRASTEASGGVTLDSIGAIAASGVDYISVGRLTQSAPAADIGLDYRDG
jgi:nicotinate-nucleotide pyrophosphorylase (carboxylating)